MSSSLKVSQEELRKHIRSLFYIDIYSLKITKQFLVHNIYSVVLLKLELVELEPKTASKETGERREKPRSMKSIGTNVISSTINPLEKILL